MKALVIGGSNGIGLAVTKKLMEKGYEAVILDIAEPEDGILEKEQYVYHAFDLMHVDEELLDNLAADQDVNLLMITAGLGRIAEFEYFSEAEIQKTMTINATSTICILRRFYDRIKSQTPFYCGVMTSIAGALSSPMAAVYAASKAAVYRCIESVNIELEAAGFRNRILNVAPASFKGSKFYGGQNDLQQLEELASEITGHVLAGKDLYIPHYEDTFRGVLERYHNDPHAFGLQSYSYKMESGRKNTRKKVVIGYLSGTFDLFHVGHLNLLKRAKQYCDYLIVGVHDSGKWKGKETFIPLEERKAIVGSCRYVDKVVDSCREDSDAWDLWHYDRLFVGSDYKGTERFQKYEAYFADKGVEIIYFPYTQGTSSTQIRMSIQEKAGK